MYRVFALRLALGRGLADNKEETRPAAAAGCKVGAVRRPPLRKRERSPERLDRLRKDGLLAGCRPWCLFTQCPATACLESRLRLAFALAWIGLRLLRAMRGMDVAMREFASRALASPARA